MTAFLIGAAVGLAVGIVGDRVLPLALEKFRAWIASK
jgi:hypothetical protein